MKKLIYLLSLLLVVTLVSCEEEEITKTDDENDGLMTLAQLDGKWYVESYLYDDILWTAGSEIPFEYNLLDNIFGDDWNFDTENMIVTAYEGDYPYTLTKKGNTFKICTNMDVVYTYTIISYTGNKFKAIFEDNEDDSSLYRYKGGEITFVR